MTQHERDFFIYQMLAGYSRVKTPDGIVIVKDPTDEIRYEAAEIFNEAVECDLYDEYEILELLYKYEIWNDDLEMEYREIPKQIENIKVSIYRDPKNKIHRKNLKDKEKRLEDILSIRHCWDAYTKKGYANFIKNQFILEKTCFLNDAPYQNIHTIFPYLSKVTPDDKQIRELSRTEPWITLYEIGKKSDNDVGKKLLIFTKMYNNIRESQNCPPEDIMEDDDALDGWMILQRRERERERNINEIDQRLGKTKGKQQIMVPAERDTFGKAIYRDLNEANKINNLNDEKAKFQKEKILRKIKE